MGLIENIERITKVAGIVGGVGAVIGVAIQLYDLNNKDREKKVDDWQMAAVYGIIERNGSPMKFDDIETKYQSKGAASTLPIPKYLLDGSHLQLALMRLINNQIVMRLENGHYTLRSFSDPFEVANQTFKIMNQFQSEMAMHVTLTTQILMTEQEPISKDVLINKVAGIGGSSKFLNENFNLIRQQMQMQGYLRISSNGMLSIGDGPWKVEKKVEAPKEVARVTNEIDWNTLRFILTTDQASSTTTCWTSPQPDHSQIEFLYKLRDLQLANITELKNERDDQKRRCTLALRMDLTSLFASTQAYYYESIKLLLTQRQ